MLMDSEAEIRDKKKKNKEPGVDARCRQVSPDQRNSYSCTKETGWFSGRGNEVRMRR